MSKKSQLIIALCLLTGCTQSVTSLPPVPAPADLTASCPDLGNLRGNTVGALVRYTEHVIKDYNECADMHDGLVSFEKQQQQGN